MFRTLHRILRYNHIIRICAICSLIVILSFSSVFAHPTFTDVSGMNQTVYNFTLWSDYSTTVNANYGSQTPTLTDLNLASINLWLQKMEYYIAEQTQNMHVYVPSTNSVQTLGNKHIPEMLSYLTYNTSYIAQNTGYLHSDLTSIDNSVSYLNGQMNNALYDYNHLGQSAYSVGSTSKNTAVNTLNIYNELHNINWVNTNIVSTVSVSTSFNQSNPIYPNTSNTLSPGTYYLKLPNFPYDTSNFDTNLFRFDIPFRTQWTSLFNKEWITDVSVLVDNANTIYPGNYYWDIDVMKNGQYYLRFYFTDFIPYHNNTLVIKFTTTDNWLFTSDDTKYVWYIPSSSPDYMAFNDYLNLKRLADKDFTADISGDVNVDTSDIVDAINNLSLQDNDVKLNLTINNNTGSDGTNVINRLQNFFNTGTSISDFFDNVDDAENGWFTQTNSDLINTLSGGYVDLYE